MMKVDRAAVREQLTRVFTEATSPEEPEFVASFYARRCAYRRIDPDVVPDPRTHEEAEDRLARFCLYFMLDSQADMNNRGLLGIGRDKAHEFLNRSKIFTEHSSYRQNGGFDCAVTEALRNRYGGLQFVYDEITNLWVLSLLDSHYEAIIHDAIYAYGKQGFRMFGEELRSVMQDLNLSPASHIEIDFMLYPIECLTAITKEIRELRKASIGKR